MQHLQAKDALAYHREGNVASRSGLQVLESFTKTLVLANPENDFEKETFQVKVVIKKAQTRASPPKTGGYPTAEGTTDSGNITSELLESNLDATIILGEPRTNKKASYYLLFAQPHCMKIGPS